MLLPRGHEPMDNSAYPWLLAGAKTLSYAVNMAVLRYVQERGADDAIFITTSVACWRVPPPRCWSPRLRTARRCCTRPSRVTASFPVPRRARCSRRHARPVGELGFGPLYPQDLFESDGVWLASSVRLIAPVTHLNGTALAHDPELTATLLNYLAQQS